MFVKILFTHPLKHSNFWHSADVKPMSNDLVHAVHWQCMFALSICLIQSLWTQMGTFQIVPQGGQGALRHSV